MASTHTDVYRRFLGPRRPAHRPWVPIASSGLRTATKRKLPLLLFAPPAIATVIFSFVVYARFAIESGLGAGPIPSSGPAMAGVALLAGKLIDVRDQIVQFNVAMSFFALLIMAWYGSGLIAEDRRLGAHLLYFARPLTRIDYLLGKFLVLAFFGFVAVLVPGLVICTIAAFSSPDWSFLKQEGSVIWRHLLFSLVWVISISSVVLAISSLSERKTFALVGTFAFFLMTNGIAVLLAGLQREPMFGLLSLQGNLLRLSGAIFDTRAALPPRIDWNPIWSWLAVAAFVAIAWTVLCVRVRPAEVIR
jgi:ABC-2 type transport system permease protein